MRTSKNIRINLSGFYKTALAASLILTPVILFPSSPFAASSHHPKKKSTPAKIKPKIPKGSLSIVSQPPGAELIFNAQKKGRTPVIVKLTKKNNRIVLRLRGYLPYDAMIEKNTLTRELTVGLTPEPGNIQKPQFKPPPQEAVHSKALPEYPAKPDSMMRIPERLPQPTAVEAGTVFVSSSPSGASLTLDGQSTGAKTPLKLELAPGLHHFEMEHDGLKGSVDYQVNPGKNKALLLQLQ